MLPPALKFTVRGDVPELGVAVKEAVMPGVGRIGVHSDRKDAVFLPAADGSPSWLLI